MDLNEIQAVWSEMSNQLESQKKLTNKIIMDMTQQRYTNKFRTISTYETIGAVFCFIITILILINFQKLDTWYLIVSGIITLAFISVLPIMTLRLLGRVKNYNILDKDIKETLIGYRKAKKNLMMLQEFAVYTSFIVMFSSAAVFAKLMGNRDFFMVELGLWEYGVIGFALVFVFFFSRWGYRCYKSITNSAENILKELE